MNRMLKGKRDFLNNISFQRKMVIIYVICVILPIIVLSSFYYAITVRKVDARNVREIENALLNAKNSIQTIIDRATLISDLLYDDDDIYNALSLREGDGKSLIRFSDSLDKKIRSYVINGSLESIDIYSDNEYLYRGVVLKKMSDVKNEKWLTDFLASDDNARVLTYYDNNLDRYQISMLRKMNKKKRDDASNVIKLNFSLTDISQALYAYSEKRDLYLVQDNKIIALRKYSADKKDPEYSIGDEFDAEDKRTILKKLDFPAQYQVAAFYNPDHMVDMFGAETITFIALIFFILFFSSIVIFIITKSQSTKLNRLTECALKIQRGIFETVDDKNMGKDEIGTLTRGINDAIVTINSLINKVYKEKIKNAEIEKAQYKTKLSALQGQVNPHFMFNIFEVMRMKALKKKDREQAAILKEISKMFRHLISWEEDMIRLVGRPNAGKSSIVNAFIGVQSYSMDDEVEISISIAEETKQCYIPKMSVQVFVENAFLHGLESISSDKKFSLNAYLSENNLCIEICDNGQGFDEEFADAINSGKIDVYLKNKGVGIKNVITRLRLYFNDEFGIHVLSIPYKKTQIKLTLPVKYK